MVENLYCITTYQRSWPPEAILNRANKILAARTQTHCVLGGLRQRCRARTEIDEFVSTLGRILRSKATSDPHA